MARYWEDLQGEVSVKTSADGPLVRAHAEEWKKLMDGLPLEINPSTGSGFRVMSVEEWAGRWKPSAHFPQCGACGGARTKEHWFEQTWCRGRKRFTSEAVCLDCHAFTLREYADPDFKTPEQWDKERWTEETREQMSALRLAQRNAGASSTPA